MRRVFLHPDGRKYVFEVVDCRIHESWWDAKGKGQGRRPHPVFDLAVRKKPKAEPDFLVFDPATFDRNGTGAFPMKGAIEVLARNHANEIRSFRPDGPEPDIAELRAWFGFAPKSE